MKLFLAIIFFLSFSLNGYSAIYEQRNSNHSVIYSDVPSNNAQPVNLPPSKAIVSTPSQSSPSSEDTQAAAQTPALQPASTPQTVKGRPYTRFIMTAPTNQETFQNQRDIPVKIEVKPSLQKGDKVQLFIDGKPVAAATANLNSLALHQVDRGEHQLSAVLMDNQGHILKKIMPITIYIHYSAIPTGVGAVPGSNRTAP